MTIDEMLKIGGLMLGTGGVGAAIRAAWDGWMNVRSGEAEAEKARTQDLTKQRDDAWLLVASERKRADDAEAAEGRAAARARIYAEHASQVRRIAIEAGIPPSQLPPFPTSKEA